jgi:hypothetical protein
MCSSRCNGVEILVSIPGLTPRSPKTQVCCHLIICTYLMHREHASYCNELYRKPLAGENKNSNVVAVWHTRGAEVHIHSFLNSTLLGATNFWPQQLYPEERAPSNHWTGGWVGLGNSLYVLEKRKISSPPRTIHSLVTVPSTYLGFKALEYRSDITEHLIQCST